MFEHAQHADFEDLKTQAALHGIKIKGNQPEQSSGVGDGTHTPIFGDPEEYMHMTPQQREQKTQEQMAALMNLPFASNIKGFGEKP